MKFERMTVHVLQSYLIRTHRSMKQERFFDSFMPFFLRLTAIGAMQMQSCYLLFEMIIRVWNRLEEYNATHPSNFLIFAP